VFSQDHARFRALRALIAAEPDPAREETYIVSERSPHNVKVRNNRLEIKRLIRGSRDGLQLWTPVLSATFPLADSDLRAVARALKVKIPPYEVRAQALFSPHDLERHFVFANQALRAVTITKQRTRLLLDHCHGELVEVVIRNEEWTSVAFEDQDAAVVRRAIEHLALNTFTNTSYPAALKSLIPLMPAGAAHSGETV
jgi:hypothetical protein